VQRAGHRSLPALGPVAVLLGWSTVATAQSVNTEEVDHRGPAVSLALGSGYAADEAGGGIAAVGSTDIGWFFTDRLGALVGISGVTRTGDEQRINHTLGHLGAELWLSSGWYLRASVGGMLVAEKRRLAAGSSRTTRIEALGRGIGGLIALGHPVWSWRWLAVNLQLAAGAGRFPDQTPASGAYHVTTCFELAIQ
jgi:hypothetical protein